MGHTQPDFMVKGAGQGPAHGMINNLGDRFPNLASTSTSEKTSLTNRIGLWTSMTAENLGQSGQAVSLRKSQTSRVGMD